MTTHASPTKYNGPMPPTTFVAATFAEDAEEREILLSEIDPDPEQPRQYFSEEEEQALADSIAADGQQNAGIVYLDPETGRYRLIAGERRWRALRRLGKKTMRNRVLKEVPDKATRSRLRLLDNELQKSLSRLEKGFAWDSHIALVGCTASALAQTVGTSVSTLTRTIKDAQRLCAALKERFRAGTLPPDIAEELLTLPGDAQLAIANQYPNPLRTKAEVKAAVRNFKNSNGKATAATAGSFICEEGGCRIAVTLPAGGDLAAAAAALKLLLEDLRKQGNRGLEHWKTYLAKKKAHGKKAAQLRAAQDALTQHGTGGNISD